MYDLEQVNAEINYTPEPKKVFELTDYKLKVIGAMEKKVQYYEKLVSYTKHSKKLKENEFKLRFSKEVLEETREDYGM
ncbi:hypothetical protein bcgnr5390_12730 [Bacillus luti]|nr:hypothetical protein BC2903_51410 [Bacillus cereus]